jgi:hypothetical protein
MKVSKHLGLAFQSGRKLRVEGGTGVTRVRRLGDLLLQTGRILIGYPGTPYINDPSPVRPEVPPGQYPVFACLVDLPKGLVRLAFVSIRFAEEAEAAWEEAGSFFTDSGTGCLMDESCVPLLEKRGEGNPGFHEELRQVKAGVFTDGNCSLPLDPKSGANAIVFRTFDSRFPCFVGKDRLGKSVCLVVDCR